MPVTDGGPAFPTEPRGIAYGRDYDGMTLRDWFAGQALVTLGDVNPRFPEDAGFPSYWPEPQELADRRAKWSYMQADAMLAARKGGLDET